MKIKIKKPKLSDAKKLIELHNSVWKTTYSYRLSKSELDKHKNKNSDIKEWEYFIKDKILYIAKDEEKNVGFVMGSEPNPYVKKLDPTSDSKLSSLFILKEYQGYGLGGMLTKKLLKSFSKKGFKQVGIWAFKNDISQKFYKKAGAVRSSVKEIKTEYGIAEVLHIKL